MQWNHIVCSKLQSLYKLTLKIASKTMDLFGRIWFERIGHQPYRGLVFITSHPSTMGGVCIVAINPKPIIMAYNVPELMHGWSP